MFDCKEVSDEKHPPGDSRRDQTSSPNVGGHFSPLKRVNFFTIPKRSLLQSCPAGCLGFIGDDSIPIWGLLTNH